MKITTTKQLATKVKQTTLSPKKSNYQGTLVKPNLAIGLPRLGSGIK